MSKENQVKTSVKISEKEDHKDTIPVDTGWAWAICLAGFMIHIVIGSGGQTMAVLFVEVLDKYHSSIFMGSMVFMVNVLAFSFSSTLCGTVLVPRFKEKATLFVGGLLTAASSLGQAYSPSMAVFIVMSALKGFAVGFCLVPSVSLIGFYFNKRRSIASVIVVCGGSVAGIVAPFVIRATRKEYGISGSFFLLGAMELHMCLAGLMMRPLSAYRKGKEDPEIQSLATKENVHENGSVKEVRSSQSELNHNEKDPESQHALLKPSESIEHDKHSLTHSLPNSLPNSLIMDFLKPEKDYGSQKIREEHRSQSLFYGSALTLASEPGLPALEVMMEKNPSPEEEDGEKLGRVRRFIRNTSLGTCSVILLLCATVPGSANTFLFSYLPAIANSKGADLDQSALLMTIMCATDVSSRLVMGFIADTKKFPPSRLLAGSMLFLGAVCHFFRLATEFPTLVIMAIMIGLVVGARVSLVPLVCIEVVGVERMSRVYSVICTATTLSVTAWNPSLGAIAESTGSFVVPMHVLATGFVISAILFWMIECFIKRNSKSSSS